MAVARPRLRVLIAGPEDAYNDGINEARRVVQHTGHIPLAVVKVSRDDDEGLSYRQFQRHHVAALADADVFVVLPGWEADEFIIGLKLLAYELDMPIYELEMFEEVMFQADPEP